MPVYEYKCANDHIYIEQRSIHEGPRDLLCDICSTVLKRYFQIGKKTIKYKGDGYYLPPGTTPPGGQQVIG
jgi:predicted nucleic acid-binding Zn ribbon protein